MNKFKKLEKKRFWFTKTLAVLQDASKDKKEFGKWMFFISNNMVRFFMHHLRSKLQTHPQHQCNSRGWAPSLPRPGTLGQWPCSILAASWGCTGGNCPSAWPQGVPGPVSAPQEPAGTRAHAGRGWDNRHSRPGGGRGGDPWRSGSLPNGLIHRWDCLNTPE